MASTIDAVLQTKSVLGKGLNSDDIRLEAVNAKQKVTVIARKMTETVSYVIGAEGNSFSLVLTGPKGSKLFPEEITIRTSTWPRTRQLEQSIPNVVKLSRGSLGEETPCAPNFGN